jgi:hypothetical protein
MEFRLTYAGQLLAHRDDKRLEQRSLHVHAIRRVFHKQLAALWHEHPILKSLWTQPLNPRQALLVQRFDHDGFSWLPIVSDVSGLICKLDILSLRMARGPYELGANTPTGQVKPQDGETPFYVLLEDDRLITHLSVTSDTLLETIEGVPFDEAARLVIDVTVRPYHPYLETLGYT